jgi:hypothetical protein
MFATLCRRKSAALFLRKGFSRGFAAFLLRAKGFEEGHFDTSTGSVQVYDL